MTSVFGSVWGDVFGVVWTHDEATEANRAYYVVARDTYTAGAITADSFHAGAVREQTFHAGAVVTEAN